MVAATGRLVGREEELGALVRLLEAPGEAPNVAVLAGEAGIGKTSVWLAACEEAVARGWRVLSTRPTDVEAGWSFAGLGDLLGDAAPEVLPGLPGVQRRALETALLLGEPAGEVDDRTIAAATLSALRALADEQPVLVAVDDVQWLDAASLAAVRHAISRLDAERVAAVLTVRGQVPDWLGRAVPEPRLATVEIGGLSLGATHQILRSRLDGFVARPALIRIWEATRGNPLYALELAQALRGRAMPTPGEPLPVPSTLDELLRARIDGLGPKALDVARVAAALANPTEHVLQAALGQAEEGLAEAARARVVELDGDRVRFTHPLVAAAVTAAQPPSRRRALHARLATIAPTFEERARHLALATASPDARVATVLDDAATRAAARGAPAASAELAEQALRLTRADDRAGRVRRAIAAAVMHHGAGDSTRAISLLEQARAAATPGRERAAVLVELADVIAWVADRRAATDLFRQALADATDDDALLARIHTDLAEELGLAGGLESAVEHASLAVEAAVRSGDVGLLCCARAVAAFWRLAAGEGLQRSELEDAMAAERDLADWPLGSGPTEYLALQLVWVGELGPARALFAELRDVLRAREHPGGEAYALWSLAWLEWRAGDWTVADGYATTSAALQEQLGRPPDEFPRAAVAAHRGQLDEALRIAAEATPGEGIYSVPAAFEWLLGFIDVSLGDAAAALPHLRRSHEAHEAFMREPAQRFELGDLLEALVAVGELEEAEHVLATPTPSSTPAPCSRSAAPSGGRSGAPTRARRSPTRSPASSGSAPRSGPSRPATSSPASAAACPRATS